MFYADPSVFNGTRAEFVCTRSGLRLLLSLLWCPITSKMGEKFCQVQVSSESFGTKTLWAYIYEGGEKLLFSKTDSLFLLDQWSHGSTITLRVHFYETTISASGFTTCWKQASKFIPYIESNS